MDFTSRFSLLITRPIAIVMVVILRVTGLLSRLSRKFASRAYRHTNSSALMNDPIRRAEQFVEGLEENLLPQQQFSLYHSDHDMSLLPPFFKGSYTQALYMATHRAKFLYIYLTHQQNEGSKSIFDKVVSNPRFVNLFGAQNENNIIWGGDLTNPEAYQLANSLHITKFPMLGLICLARTTTMTPEGPQKSSPRISLISKIQGGLDPQVDADALIYNKFIKRMLKYEPELSNIRSELKKKYMAEALRQNQMLDFQRSLAKDREKKKAKERAQIATKFLEWKQPYFMVLKDDTDRSQRARIAFKLTDGLRTQIFFPKSSPIEDLFTYVELLRRNMLSLELEPTISDDEAALLFADFQMKYDFRLSSGVPPRPCLNDLNLATPIEEVPYVYPNGVLMVESL